MAEQDVKQIKHARDPNEVNAYLKAGWVLLTVTPGQTEEGGAWPLYSLGWTQDGEPGKPEPWWLA